MGAIMVIGGHEDRTGQRTILREFLRLAGGDGARLAILAVASEEPEDAGETYRRLFNDLGAALVTVLSLRERSEALDPKGSKKLAAATGVFFPGGDQLRITALLGGTPWLETLQEAHGGGAVLAGTSAGASVMSATMVVAGAGDASPRKEILRMSPGLGFLPELVIDQHFAQRGRINRLLLALAQHPGLLGVGLDEDTALVVDAGIGWVVGSRTVTVLDGRGLSLNNVSELGPDETLALDGVRLSILKSGYGYQLSERRVLTPE